MPPVKKAVDLKKLDWFTLQQAGELLQLSAKTVQRRCFDGTIRAKQFGSKLRIPKTELDRLAQLR